MMFFIVISYQRQQILSNAGVLCFLYQSQIHLLKQKEFLKMENIQDRDKNKSIPHVDSGLSSGTTDDDEMEEIQIDQAMKIMMPDYTFQKRLSANRHSSVWKAYSKIKQETVAIKILSISNMTPSQRFHCQQQVEALKTLKSPYFLQIQQIIEQSTHIFIIMEYLCRGDLANYITYSPLGFNLEYQERQEQVRNIIAEVFLALTEVHKQGYIYRDLKPENILFDAEGHVKLCDFGLSIAKDKVDSAMCGTIDYMAPQMLSRKSKRLEKSDSAMDFWSLGILCYQLLIGQLPYTSQNPSDLLEQIYSCSPQIPKSIPIKARNLIYKLLEVNKRKRMNSEQFKQDQFFKVQGFDWATLSKQPKHYFEKQWRKCDCKGKSH